MQFLTSNGKLFFFVCDRQFSEPEICFLTKWKNLNLSSTRHKICTMFAHTKLAFKFNARNVKMQKLFAWKAYPQSHVKSILYNMEIAKQWTKTISQFSIMHGRGMLWLHSSICFLAPQDSPLANGSVCFRRIFDIDSKVEVNHSFFEWHPDDMSS